MLVFKMLTCCRAGRGSQTGGQGLNSGLPRGEEQDWRWMHAAETVSRQQQYKLLHRYLQHKGGVENRRVLCRMWLLMCIAHPAAAT